MYKQPLKELNNAQINQEKQINNIYRHESK